MWPNSDNTNGIMVIKGFTEHLQACAYHYLNSIYHFRCVKTEVLMFLSGV